MKHIERNPDIDLDREEIPPGLTLIHGKNLHHTARSKGIPFGVASASVMVRHGRVYSRKETVGLIIRDHDVDAFTGALAAKGPHQPKAGRAE